MMRRSPVVQEHAKLRAAMRIVKRAVQCLVPGLRDGPRSRGRGSQDTCFGQGEVTGWHGIDIITKRDTPCPLGLADLLALTQPTRQCNLDRAHQSAMAPDRTPRVPETPSSLRACAAISRVLLHDDVERAVAAALGVLVRGLDVDRAYVFENLREEGMLVAARQRYEYARDPALAQLDNPDLQDAPYDEGFTRWRDVLADGTPVQGRVRDFPASERQLLVPQRIASLMAVPIVVDGTFWGFLGCDECRYEREWHEADVALLTLTANSMAAALMRHRSEVKLAAQRQEMQAAARSYERSMQVLRQAAAEPPAGPLFVQTATKVVPLDPADILWVEAEGNYSALHTATATYLTRQYLSTLEERLAPHGFLRIHRSTLVALHALEYLEPTDDGTYRASLRNGAQLRVSRTYVSSIKELII